MKREILILAVLAWASTTATGRDPVLTGIMSLSSNNVKLAIAFPEAGGSYVTEWLEVGQSHDGYTVLDFDASTETATLARGDEPIRLNLQESTIVDSSPRALTREQALEAIQKQIDKTRAEAKKNPHYRPFDRV
ncbi:hypothetical protein ASA1KI_07340 [Opitutales bacterium ASA1]|uniref:hypothetical protein n=1 Tax=Congregicoccus parvus TaxID=3081749 RepID=UPI002B324320|nr:hypothetical protein ASA1KI_07340 [Opitutales bacterium ASA1]